MTLTMIKLEPRTDRLIRWAEQRKLLPPQSEDDLGYALHALLVATFGKDGAPKPFVLQRDSGRPAALLAYSPLAGDDLERLARATAEPDAAEAIGLGSFAAKAMPENWPAGLRFRFAVRVRPMLRTDRDGDRTRSREVDAFVLSPPQSERGVVYADWLRQRLKGAQIGRATLDAFRLSHVRRRDAARSLRSQRGPDATFTGTLTVTDGEAFAQTLARGVGRHRSFGFGMLLLRPA